MSTQKVSRKSAATDSAAPSSVASSRAVKRVSGLMARAVSLKPREATPVLDNIDLNLPINSRPMVGMDLQRFQAQHNLQMVDAIYALGVQNSAVYGRLARGGQLPYAVEMLIRLYDRHPGPSPWGSHTPTDGFDLLYGDVVRDFESFQGGIYRDLACKALYARMTAAFGRSVFTSYRWFNERAEGNAKVQVTRILGKLSAVANPRDEFESIVRLMYRVRGANFDSIAPLPTRENPPQAKKRGPIPGRARKPRNAAAAAKVNRKLAQEAAELAKPSQVDSQAAVLDAMLSASTTPSTTKSRAVKSAMTRKSAKTPAKTGVKASNKAPAGRKK